MGDNVGISFSWGPGDTKAVVERGISENKPKREPDGELQSLEGIRKHWKKDPYLTTFVICAVLSLLFSVLTLMGFQFFIGFFEPYVWLILAISFAFSAFLCFHKKQNYSIYPLVVFVTFVALRIRTSNLAGLRDITTGAWTLGRDSDPFLFLRYAKHIVETGSLMALDTMRYVPNGFNTNIELILHPYLIAYFHKIASFLGTESVTHSAVLFPAVMFGLTVIAFFFLTRKIFLDVYGKKIANTIALVASLFLSVSPSLIERTVAGIPEKESAALLFIFLAFYFYICSWKSKRRKSQIIFALLAGTVTGATALIWGGYGFIFLTLGMSVFVSFFLGKMTKIRIFSYAIWIFSAFLIMYPFPIRYSIRNLLASSITGSAVAVLFIMLLHELIFKSKMRRIFTSRRLSKIPPRILTTVLSAVLFTIFALILFGKTFITTQLSNALNDLVRPATTRLIQTVAESRQPYFVDWMVFFGPNFQGIPITFLFFFLGMIFLFVKIMGVFKKKERWIISSAFTLFLIGLVFSRFSRDSVLNGENSFSLALYLGGFILFVIAFGFYYFKYHNKGEGDGLKKIDFGLIFLFVLSILLIVAARGAIRLIMMLSIPVSIFASYFVVMFVVWARRAKDDVWRLLSIVLAFIIVLSAIISVGLFYQEGILRAQFLEPEDYTHQWQKAMSWVRENTPQNSVFASWWDYGYWIQTIGERATVLDGGNSIAYWNHMMSRYALTGANEREALEFLYAHNSTYFLIDNGDIGKYGSYSSIGSDESFDRASNIIVFYKDGGSREDKENSSMLFYRGTAWLDEDLVYDNNGSRGFLPGWDSGLGGIMLELNSEGKVVSQPVGVFVYKDKQINLPLRYAFDGEFVDYGSGIESGVFIIPWVTLEGEDASIDETGALLYLSNKSIKSQFARLYLFGEEIPGFKLVHSEDDLSIIRMKNANFGFEYEMVVFEDFKGPIKIWELEYPEDIELNERYLSREFPEKLEISSGSIYESQSFKK